MGNSPPAAGRGAVTIAAIADEAGVSVATVSKVLNGRSDVARATRERIEASLERHAYRRRHRRQPAGLEQIELVFHEFGSGWTLEIIQGVEATATAMNVSLVVSQLGGVHRPPQKWLEGVLGRRPLGVLLVQSNLSRPQQQQLESRSIQFVVVDTDGETPTSAPTIGSNNWNGGLVATRHLLELGHRRVAIISGPENMLCSRARIAGFRSAQDEAGVPVDLDLIRHGNFGVAGGYEHGLALLSRPDRPTGIFAGSDMQAMGVLRAARKLGLRVPEDLSVVGYDNLTMSAWLGPSLTTVNQPLRDMAGAAARMLLDLAQGIEPPTRRIDLATDLVVRESTAPPPAL